MNYRHISGDIPEWCPLPDYKTQQADSPESCKYLFESIICLCAEGPECHTRIELMDAILKEAEKGYKLSQVASEQADSPDQNARCVCDKCGQPHNYRALKESGGEGSGRDSDLI